MRHARRLAPAKEALTAIACSSARLGQVGPTIDAPPRLPRRRARRRACTWRNGAPPVPVTAAARRRRARQRSHSAASCNLLSDYRFRGVSRSDEDPAAQAGCRPPRKRALRRVARPDVRARLDGFRLRDPRLPRQRRRPARSLCRLPPRPRRRLRARGGADVLCLRRRRRRDRLCRALSPRSRCRPARLGGGGAMRRAIAGRRRASTPA